MLNRSSPDYEVTPVAGPAAKKSHWYVNNAINSAPALSWLGASFGQKAIKIQQGGWSQQVGNTDTELSSHDSKSQTGA